MISKFLGLDDFWEKICSGLGAILAFFSLTLIPLLERELGPLGILKILIQLQLIDLVMGTYAAWRGKGKHHPTLKSDVGIKGINKKILCWFWVFLIYKVDLGLGTNLRDLFVKAYIAFGALSIAEIWIALKWFGSKTLEKLLVSKLKEIKNSLLDELKPKRKRE
jgi:toxin secretion/phage lysis holin